MTNEEYQAATAKTAIYPAHNAIEYLSLGLASEAGEVAGKFAKLYRKNMIGEAYSGGGEGYKITNIETADREAIVYEVGDVLWFCSEMLSLLGYTLSDAMQMNIDKLQGRKERGTIEGSGDYR